MHLIINLKVGIYFQLWCKNSCSIHVVSKNLKFRANMYAKFQRCRQILLGPVSYAIIYIMDHKIGKYGKSMNF